MPSGPFCVRAVDMCARYALSRAGICSTGTMLSTRPVAAALAGMPAMAMWSIAACASVRPPRSLIALSPRAPSLPAPERMMHTALSPWSSASEAKKVSMGKRYCRGGAGLLSCSTPPLMVSVASGGMM